LEDAGADASTEEKESDLPRYDSCEPGRRYSSPVVKRTVASGKLILFDGEDTQNSFARKYMIPNTPQIVRTDQFASLFFGTLEAVTAEGIRAKERFEKEQQPRQEEAGKPDKADGRKKQMAAMEEFLRKRARQN